MELFKIGVVFISIFAASLGHDSNQCPSPPSSNHYKKYKFPNECPACSYVANVNLDFIDGGWFQQFATVNGSQAGCSGTCVTMYGSIESETANSLEYCCNKNGNAFCGASVGSAILEQDSNNPAGVFSYHIFGQDFAEVIVDIDYDVYFSTYKCFYQGNQRTEIGEIWSRKRVLSQSIKTRAFNKLNAIFKDKNLLMPIAQSTSCMVAFSD